MVVTDNTDIVVVFKAEVVSFDKEGQKLCQISVEDAKDISCSPDGILWVLESDKNLRLFHLDGRFIAQADTRLELSRLCALSSHFMHVPLQ